MKSVFFHTDNIIFLFTYRQCSSIITKIDGNRLLSHYFSFKFENWWTSISDMATIVASGAKPRFIVDGQAPMRQCLHPEACNKDIELPEYYNYFYDLRKDFVECYSSHGELSTLGVQEMLQCILLCKNRCQLPRWFIFILFFSTYIILLIFFVPVLVCKKDIWHQCHCMWLAK